VYTELSQPMQHVQAGEAGTDHQRVEVCGIASGRRDNLTHNAPCRALDDMLKSIL
jgi:hypothetical protein